MDSYTARNKYSENIGFKSSENVLVKNSKNRMIHSLEIEKTWKRSPDN